MFAKSISKQCIICITIFICGAIIGGTAVFYVQKANLKKRDTLLTIEAASLLIPPLLALQNNNSKSAAQILKDLLNKATLVIIKADKNSLNEKNRQLQFIYDSRKTLNCRLKNERLEQDISEFFNDLERSNYKDRKVQLLRRN